LPDGSTVTEIGVVPAVKGLEVTNINQVWVADITYIRIMTGFVYLAVILDVFSRRVIGWALSKRIDHKLTVAALRMAIQARNPGPEVIHHSDRGVQYACGEYVKVLDDHKFKISMSASGNPYDNAFAESFMKTLKKEEVYLWEYESFTDVVERIPQFIETVYNRKRVHSGIQYLPPVEFEDILRDEGRKQELGQVTLKLRD
jgi:transposase InsO family protein